jgi:hypothetical protein
MMKSMFKTLFDIRQDHKKREHLNNLKALFKVLQLFLFSSPSLDPTLKAFENLSTINLQLVIISGEQKHEQRANRIRKNALKLQLILLQSRKERILHPTHRQSIKNSDFNAPQIAQLHFENKKFFRAFVNKDKLQISARDLKLIATD